MQPILADDISSLVSPLSECNQRLGATPAALPRPHTARPRSRQRCQCMSMYGRRCNLVLLLSPGRPRVVAVGNCPFGVLTLVLRIGCCGGSLDICGESSQPPASLHPLVCVACRRQPRRLYVKLTRVGRLRHIASRHPFPRRREAQRIAAIHPSYR